MQYITKLLFTDSGRLAAIFLKAVFRAAETQRVMKLLLSEYVNHFSRSLCAVGPVRRGETHDERLHVAIIRGPGEHMARPRSQNLHTLTGCRKEKTSQGI